MLKINLLYVRGGFHRWLASVSRCFLLASVDETDYGPCHIKGPKDYQKALHAIPGDVILGKYKDRKIKGTDRARMRYLSSTSTCHQQTWRHHIEQK